MALKKATLTIILFLLLFFFSFVGIFVVWCLFDVVFHSYFGSDVYKII